MSVMSITPFTYRVSKTLRITSANSNFQLSRAPWPDPVNRIYRIKQLVISNPSGAAAQVVIWDQDLSNSTPVARGSAGGALINVGVAASGASGTYSAAEKFDEGQLPDVFFQGGIAVQANQINVAIAAELEVA